MRRRGDRERLAVALEVAALEMKPLPWFKRALTMPGASCFAGKLRSPGGPRHSQPGGDGPTPIPTHATGVPLAWPEDCSRWSCPSWG